jgi:hypothetical protein
MNNVSESAAVSDDCTVVVEAMPPILAIIAAIGPSPLILMFISVSYGTPQVAASWRYISVRALAWPGEPLAARGSPKIQPRSAAAL